MNDFNKPIRPVKRIQGNSTKKDISLSHSHQESSFEHKHLSPDSPAIFLCKLQQIKNFFKKLRNFSKANKKEAVYLNKDALQKLKQHLIDIGEKNPTQHPEFALVFASTWKEILEDVQNHPNAKCQLLIDSFKTYPGRNAYSIHFYLTRFSGKEWFPLPFFELLKSLHEEYRRSIKTCQIDRWTHLIDDIVSSPSAADDNY